MLMQRLRRLAQKLYELVLTHRANRIENYGLAGIAFACSLVTVSYTGENDALGQGMHEATRHFLIAMPLLLSAPSLEKAGSSITAKGLSVFVVLLAIWAHVMGQLLVLMGIYLLFSSVHQGPAMILVIIAGSTYLFLMILRSFGLVKDEDDISR